MYRTLPDYKVYSHPSTPFECLNQVVVPTMRDMCGDALQMFPRVTNIACTDEAGGCIKCEPELLQHLNSLTGSKAEHLHLICSAHKAYAIAKQVAAPLLKPLLTGSFGLRFNVSY